MKLHEITPLNENSTKVLRRYGVSRIKKGDIAATLKHVSELSGIPTKDLIKIGSTGKLPDSGDIDLAIDSNKYDPILIHQRMMDAVNQEGTNNTGTKVASYAVPIRGDESKGKVQVDFMFTSNPDWAKFSYYSEGEGSRYKGAVRAILLSAVASVLNEPGTDYFEYNEDDELIIRAGRTVDLAQGLRRIFQYRPKDKRGERYLKTLKSIPIEEFKEMFPEVEIKGGQVIIDDPQKVLKVLFGPDVGVDDVRTVEQILSLIRKKFDLEKQEKIKKHASKRAKSLQGKMKLPPDW